MINTPDYTAPINSSSWKAWFTKAIILLGVIESSGTTANRPTKNLWVGRFYFDTTLNKPIWVKTTSPSSTVWVDATGTTV